MKRSQLFVEVGYASASHIYLRAKHPWGMSTSSCCIEHRQGHELLSQIHLGLDPSSATGSQFLHLKIDHRTNYHHGLV